MNNAAVEDTVSMSAEPRRFILQAIDPDHGSPVLEALFVVGELEDLRTLLNDARDDPELERRYMLNATDLVAINKRFGIGFEPEGLEVRLASWHSSRDIPYLVHSDYELPLLLEGRKQLAKFCEHYPELHFHEEKFDRYVAVGVLHKEVVVDLFEPPIYRQDSQIVKGLRTVYYTRKGEEWRIAASKLVAAAAKHGWSLDFERLEGMLFGYEDWQNDWWIDDLHKRRHSFGCIPLCRAVSAKDLAWIEAAGYRALPPTDGSPLHVSVLRAQENDSAARRLIERSGAIALVQLSVQSRFFLDLVDGQTGPNYTIPAGRLMDLNRNIVGEIKIVARRETLNF